MNTRWTPLLLFSLSSILAAAEIDVVSKVDPAVGPSLSGGGASFVVAATPDGRYVLFNSSARNLTTNSPTLRSLSWSDAFVQDRTSKTISRVGALELPDRKAYGLALSTDGSKALCGTVALDGSGPVTMLLRDVANHTAIMISDRPDGTPANGSASDATMTPDGNYVAFVSSATNLVANDTNTIEDVYLRDVRNNETTLVSVGANASTATSVGTSSEPDISSDGTKIAFSSTATDIVQGVPTIYAGTRYSDVYVRDVLAGSTLWASKDSRALLWTYLGVSAGHSYRPVLSRDGRYLAFLASRPSTNRALVLRYDSLENTTAVVHTNALAGVPPYTEDTSLSISPDGRYVAFVARADASGSTASILVWDGQDGSLTLASGDLQGQVPSQSAAAAPVLSADGRTVAFISNAIGLVTNSIVNDFHLYVRKLDPGVTFLADSGLDRSASTGVVPSGPVLNADATVLFFSALDGLDPTDHNGDYDVYARDLTRDASELVSQRSEALGSWTPNVSTEISSSPISRDGEWIVFSTRANGVTPGDVNNQTDAYAVSLGGLRTVMLSTYAESGASGGAEASISADGKWAAFTAALDNPTLNDTNAATDVYLRNIETGELRLVSCDANGVAGDDHSYAPLVGAGGRYVLFRTHARTVESYSSPGFTEGLFLRDMELGKTFALSVARVPGSVSFTPDGTRVGYAGYLGRTASIGFYVWDSALQAHILTNANVSTFGGALSPNGKRYAIWTSGGATLVHGDVDTGITKVVYTNSFPIPSPARMAFSGDGRFLVFLAKASNSKNRVLLYDNLTEALNVVGGEQGMDADSPVISPDGRWVAFRSGAQLFPGDSNGLPDLFLYDIQTTQTRLITHSWTGDFSGAGRTCRAAFSGDSRILVFTSWADDIQQGDYNGAADLFTYRLPSGNTVSPFPVSFEVSAGLINLSWNAQPDVSYTVQSTGDFAADVWTTLNLPVAVVDNVARVSDTLGKSNRFYRVTAKPN